MEESLKYIFSNPYLSTVFAVWIVVWRGLALWKASRNEQKYWFVALLVINLFGLPEIIYLCFFQKQGSWVRKIVIDIPQLSKFKKK
jgi:hypothetical protein